MANPKITVEFGANTRVLDKALKDTIAANKKQNQQLKETQKKTTNFDLQKMKAQKEIAKLHDKHHKAQEKQRKQLIVEQRRAHQAQVRAEKTRHLDLMRAEKQRAAFQKKERAEEMRWNKRFGDNTRGGGSRFDKANRKGGAAAKSVMRAAAAVASSLTGFFVGAVTGAYGKANEFQQALGPSIGLGAGSRVKKGITGARGSRLGFSNIESAQMNPLMARATGALGPRELQQGMRASGMDQGAVAGIFGSMRKAGTSFSGGEFSGQSRGGREFAKLISAGMESGLEKGRLPEFAEGVMTLVDQKGSVASGDVSSSGIAAQLAALGRTGLSGFQGERGANMMGKINASFTKAGGGEWGDNFMRMAMGFGKPGGGTGFFEAEKMREKGVGDPGNMSRMLGEVTNQFGGGKEGALALRELTGVSLDQAEQLLKIQETGAMSEEKLAEIGKVMESAKSLEEQSLDNMKGIGGTLQRLAGRTNKLIGIGENVRGEIEQIEDWQFQLVDALLEVKDILKAFYEEVSAFIRSDSSEETRKAMAALDAKRGQVMANAGGKTPDQIRKEFVKNRDKEIEAAAKHEGARQDENSAPGWAETLTGITGIRLPNVRNKSTSAEKDRIRAGFGQSADKSTVDFLSANFSGKGKAGRVPDELVPHLAVGKRDAIERRTAGTFRADDKFPGLDARFVDKLDEVVHAIKNSGGVVRDGTDARSSGNRVERRNSVK